MSLGPSRMDGFGWFAAGPLPSRGDAEIRHSTQGRDWPKSERLPHLTGHLGSLHYLPCRVNNCGFRMLDDVLAALADPTRRTILRQLTKGDAGKRYGSRPPLFHLAQIGLEAHHYCWNAHNWCGRRRSGREHIISFDPAASGPPAGMDRGTTSAVASPAHLAIDALLQAEDQSGRVERKTTGALPMTAEPRGDIHLTHAFAVPADRVFDAFLCPEKGRAVVASGRRGAGDAGLHRCPGGQVDPGRYVSLRPRTVEHTGEYLEIQRPYRLSFTIRSPASAATERVTVLIEPRGAGCFLTLISAIEPVPLRALASFAGLEPYRAEKAMRSHWPALEAKAALSLGLHLVMLPLLLIALPRLQPPPGAGSPSSPAMMTVAVGAAEGVKLAQPSYAPAVVAPGEPSAIAPPLPMAPPAASEAAAAVPEPVVPAPVPAPQSEAPPTPAPAATRPAPHATASINPLPIASSRTTRQPNRTANNKRASADPPGVQALNALGASPHSINGPDLRTSRGGAPGEDGEVPGHRPREAGAQVELPLVGTICSGTISFSPDTAYYGGQKVPVQARFFRDQDGRPWIRFTLWPGAPWNLPVTVVGREIRWAGLSGNGYTLRLVGNNHLTGFAGFSNDSAAKVDFTCAGSDAHPT